MDGEYINWALVTVERQWGKVQKNNNNQDPKKNKDRNLLKSEKKKKNWSTFEKGKGIIIFWKVGKKTSRCEKGKRSWSFEEWEKKNNQDRKREKDHNLKVKRNRNS